MTVTATFAVELVDETSGAANAAASSLVKLKSKIDDDVAALRQMQSAMRNLKGNTSTSAAAFSELRARIDAQRASIASAQSRFLQLGGTFGKAEKPALTFAARMGELGATMRASGGLTGAFGAKLAALAPALLSGPVLLAAFAAGILAMGAAALVAGANLLRLGIIESDARRSEALHIEGLNMLRMEYGRSTASVNDYMAAIDRASDSTNVGRSTLEGYSRSLARAGLRGAALADAVEAMGMAAMVEGDRGAARFRMLATATRLAGGSVADLAENYRNRLGPIAHRMMLSLPNQTDRFRRSLSRLFSGLRIDGFLSSLDQVLSLFSQSTASGRALKSIIEALFQPLIDQTEAIGPVVRRFFQGMLIGALILAIGFVRVRNAAASVFGSSGVFGNIDGLTIALYAGVAAFILLSVAVGVLAGVFVGLALIVGVFVGLLLILPALAFAAGAAIAYALIRAFEFFTETDWQGLGRSVIDGLIAGMTSGRDAIVEAVRGLANSAANTFRETLGIASPSRVFADYGLNIAEGVTEGIGAGGGGVEGAVGGLVDVPSGGAVGGATSITLGDVVINAGESSNPRELAQAFRDELASLLEGVSIEMGAA